MPTMWSVTAGRISRRKSFFVCLAGAAYRVWTFATSGKDALGLLQRRTASRGIYPHQVRLPWFQLSRSDGTRPRRKSVHRVRTCGKSKGANANVSGHSQLESQSKYLIDAARTGAANKPDGQGMGELLRCILSGAAQTVSGPNRLAAWRVGAK